MSGPEASEVSASNGRSESSKSPTARNTWLVVLGMALVCMVLLWRAIRTLDVDTAMNVNAVRRIEAGSEVSHSYVVSRDMPKCAVRITVLGTSGGDRDVEVVLVRDLEATGPELSSTARVEVFRRRSAAIDEVVKTDSPGTWHLIVSNRFSLLTPKIASIAAVAMCAR